MQLVICWMPLFQSFPRFIVLNEGMATAVMITTTETAKMSSIRVKADFLERNVVMVILYTIAGWFVPISWR